MLYDQLAMLLTLQARRRRLVGEVGGHLPTANRPA